MIDYDSPTFTKKYYEYNPPVAKKDWTYKSRLSKPYIGLAEIHYKEPENPKCVICKDKGTYFEKLRPGRSRLVFCACFKPGQAA